MLGEEEADEEVRKDVWWWRWRGVWARVVGGGGRAEPALGGVEGEDDGVHGGALVVGHVGEEDS